MPGFDLVVAEGALDLAVARKLLAEGGVPSESARFLDMRGGAAFWSNAPRYEQAARHGLRVLGIRDLESAACPGALLPAHIPVQPAPGFVLRIAVRMLESWLLADAAAIAGYLRVSTARVPDKPDSVAHPKRTLIDLARNSASRAIREDLVPPGATGGIAGHWSPQRARTRSESLHRGLAAIERLA
jgi:hypothetical protein